MARPADAEEAQFMMGCAESTRTPGLPAETGHHILGHGTARGFFHASATLADQNVLVPGELLSQPIPGGAVGRVDDPEQAFRHQEVDGPIDGYAIDPGPG
jgi:hypothetical protein